MSALKNTYIQEFIKQRMAELGHENYHYEPIRITNQPYPANQQTVDASNEYYYLVTDTVDKSLIILHDGEPFIQYDAANYSTYNFHNFFEFTGQIFIKQTPPVFSYEFIRVTPYSKN